VKPFHRDMCSSPLGDNPVPFLVEKGQGFSGNELLVLGEQVRLALPSSGVEAIGVCSSSAAFIAAATLAVWAVGREPLILDPSLKSEPAPILKRCPGLSVVADQRIPGFPKATIVTPAEGDELEARWPADQETAALFFTSGSTGEPKVIRKRACQLFRQMELEIEWLGMTSGLKVSSMVPPFHILGFVYGLFLPMLCNGSTSYLHGAAPAKWIDQIADVGPDLVLGVPSNYRFLVNSLDRTLPKALYMSSGAPLPPAVDKDFLDTTGQALTQMYGSTETGGIAKRQGFGPWLPFPGLKWDVRGEDGRLMVYSPWQEQPDQWTITDDLAERFEGGFRLTGRADSVVKVGGKRFSTNEIIQIVEAELPVEAAVVVGYERFGENAIALFATAAPQKGLVEQDIRLLLAQNLAPFKVPRTIRVLDDMPYLSNGKVDSKRLQFFAVEGVDDE